MTKRILALVIFLIIFTTLDFAQEFRMATNNYTEYQVGKLPLVISVADCGNLKPSSIPYRTCNSLVYSTDAFTLEI